MNKDDITIKCSKLVKRQVPGSSFSHSTVWSFEDIEKLTLGAWHAGNYTQGYRDGVYLVKINADTFVSGIIKLDEESKLSVKYGTRQRAEDPYIQVSAIGKRLRAEQVDVVIYRHDVLAEGRENNTDADFEIVAINASPKGGTPIHPYTMARNQLVLPGGTEANYSSQEWADSVLFWNQHAMSKPKFNLWKSIKSFFRKLLND